MRKRTRSAAISVQPYELCTVKWCVSIINMESIRKSSMDEMREWTAFGAPHALSLILLILMLASPNPLAELATPANRSNHCLRCSQSCPQ